ncbi:Transposon Ty3-G Gag-Pol polyprotein-like 1, partial [Homarus americanus]
GMTLQETVPDPIVSPTPSLDNITEQLEKQYPNLFPVCAVTRSMSAHDVASDHAVSNPISDSNDTNADVISDLNDSNDLGLNNLYGGQECRLVQHDIELVEGAKPIKQAAYRMNPAKRELLEQDVNFLLAHNFIEKSSSEWVSPCLLVPKPDVNSRMCTDYRR